MFKIDMSLKKTFVEINFKNKAKCTIACSEKIY